MDNVKYEIRRGKHAPCELWSVASANGREYQNFVAEGTHTHCENIKKSMEQMK